MADLDKDRPDAEPKDEEGYGKKKRSAKFWHTQLDAAEKREKKWSDQARQVICRYLDDRETDIHTDQRRVNILWANTDVQKGLLFAKLGNPDVRRLFPKPGKHNKVARTAAIVLERCLVSIHNCHDPEASIKDSVENMLLPGRGTAWVEYEPVIVKDPETGQESIARQKIKVHHVDWCDFRHGPGKTWEDVPWVARPHLLTKTDLKEQFPECVDPETGEPKIPLMHVLEEGKDRTPKEGQEDFKRARIWEIWYKPERIRVYVADGYDWELKRQEDPYNLENFFPCPRPIYAVKPAGSMIPKPEYLQYKDQAEELDRVNTRMWRLVEKLRYCGVYDGSSEDTDTLSNIGNLQDGQFLPYKHWTSLAQGGGLQGAFQVRDLAPIAATIQTLSQRAIELVQAIYEITGLSDVMRGATDPKETLGAQQLKARFGSGRMQNKQGDVHRFVRDIVRIEAELIAEHFERDMLQEMSGVLLPTYEEKQRAEALLAQIAQMNQAAQQGQMQPPQIDPDEIAELEEIVKADAWEDVAAILRSDERRNYNIDVETDSTAFEDSEVEKQQRIEFVSAITTMLEKAVPAMTQVPQLAPLMREMTLFSARAFKIGRTLEETLEDTFNQFQNQPQQGPSPEEIKAQMEAEKMKMEAEQKKVEAELKQQEMALKMQADMQKMQMEMQKLQAQVQAMKEKAAIELMAKQVDLELKQQEAQIAAESKHMDMALKREGMALEAEKMEMGREHAALDYQMKRQMAEDRARAASQQRAA